MLILFKRWLDENYPYTRFVFGLLKIIIRIAFICSIVLIFFSPIWWKIMVASSASFLVVEMIMRLRFRILADKFMNHGE